MPPGGAVLQRPLPERHAGTAWSVEPAYVFDALCFLQPLSRDPYDLELFEGTDDAAFARLEAAARTWGASVATADGRDLPLARGRRGRGAPRAAQVRFVPSRDPQR